MYKKVKNTDSKTHNAPGTSVLQTRNQNIANGVIDSSGVQLNDSFENSKDSRYRTIPTTTCGNGPILKDAPRNEFKQYVKTPMSSIPHNQQFKMQNLNSSVEIAHSNKFGGGHGSVLMDRRLSNEPISSN
jgi:hypothetical protein